MLPCFPAGAGTREIGSKRKGKQGREEFLIRKTQPSYKHQRHFLHVPVKKIRKTFAATTQNVASIVYRPKATQIYKSPNPALNIRRRTEAVATDSLFAGAPGVDAPGHTGTQLFVGRSSLLSDCYGFCSVSKFPNTLSDTNRDRGAIDMIIVGQSDLSIQSQSHIEPHSRERSSAHRYRDIHI